MPTNELDHSTLYIDCDRTRTGPRMVPPVLGAADRKCPECGKVFRASEEWAYKIHPRAKDSANVRIFCSYGCMRAYKKRHGIGRRKEERIQRELRGERDARGRNP